MKEVFETPELEIIRFSPSDVIATSGPDVDDKGSEDQQITTVAITGETAMDAFCDAEHE